MTKKFQRTIEDFACENCEEEVKGDGYTNHCPVCLWSKHVDINPGDRKADCGGLMEPISIETEKDEHIMTHRCQICGHEKRNKTVQEDDFEKIIEISNY
ncbi:RNHCP domain-containing protein [bacterium]|nr:RNHCP domain-containing protein [bacterium]MBT3730323.1 RNHCP domain-containing protein [bacterium]